MTARSRVATALALAALGSFSLAWPAGASLAHPRARAARSVSVKDEGYLRLVHSSGSLLIDEGSAHGTLPGRVNIHFTYNGNPNVTAQITIYAHGGTLRASGAGRLSNPSSSSPSFAGTLRITGGAGRYTHAHGTGKLYGVFYRRSYALVVQTEGTLHY